MNAWEQAESLSEKHAGSGKYLRLQNDGDKAAGVFCGEPHPREVVWTGSAYLAAESAEGQRAILEGARATLRVSINVFDLADRTMKIYEMGAGTFKTLLKLRHKYGLSDWAFEVERQGAKGDPKTKYLMLPERRLEAGELDAIRLVEFHDLRADAGRPASADATTDQALPF